MVSREGRLPRSVAGFGTGIALVAAVAASGAAPVAARTPVAPAATVTRATSCAGYDFHTVDVKTPQTYDSTRSEVWAEVGGDHFFVCNPALPQGAVVTNVQFTIADRSKDAIRNCGLYRVDLRPTADPKAQELAAIPATPEHDATDVVRLSDATIQRATVDNTRYAYWLQCQLLGVEQLGAPATGLRGANVVYRISTVAPTTRATSCAGYDFTPPSAITDRAYDGGLSEIFATLQGNNYFVCNPSLPQGAVVKKVLFTVADRGPGTVEDCGLFRSDLRSNWLGFGVAMALMAETGASEQPGLVRLTDATIQNATIDNTRFAYWLRCRLNGWGTWGAEPSVGLRGANVIFQGGLSPSDASPAAATRATSCFGFAFHAVDHHVQQFYHPGQGEALTKNGDHFLICNPDLPQGAVVTKVQLTVADRGADLVHYCGLYRVDLRATAPGVAEEVAHTADTPTAGAPGIVRLTDTTILNATIDNTSYAYWLQCAPMSGDLIGGDKPSTGLRGANVVYQGGS